MAAGAPLSAGAVGRRALLAGAGAALLAACGESTTRSLPGGGGDGGRLTYGDHPDQFGDLGLPDGDPRAVVVLVHGGFWLSTYPQSLMNPLAADLRGRGYATWNVEYRRMGSGGGYPTTFADVAAAVDHVAELGLRKDLPVVLVGHSAGGHLVAWAASRDERTPGGKPRVRPATTISLGGVLSLAAAARTGVGSGAVPNLMGGMPEGRAEEYALADPIQLVPAHGSVIAVHAEADQFVPAAQARTYVDADLAAGGAAQVLRVPGDHFALIDPRSAGWAKVLPEFA